MRCVVKHLGLNKTVHGLELLQATETEGEEYGYLCDVMREVFVRLNGLIRQLQTMAEMEQKWAHELDDVREGVLQPSAAFFNEFHLQEVPWYSRLHVLGLESSKAHLEVEITTKYDGCACCLCTDMSSSFCVESLVNRSHMIIKMVEFGPL